jgi:ankyrin repeat protein
LPHDIVSSFIEAAVWTDELAPADAILAQDPNIASRSIYAAAILGDDQAVRRFIEQDPGSATAKGGPRGWDALTYLCFSGYLGRDRDRAEQFVRAGEAVLDAGASPNAGFFDPNHKPAPQFESVLYAASGVAHHPELTRLLLERGADANDVEVFYHSPETLDNRALKVLVQSGKVPPDGIRAMLSRKFDWHDDEGVAWLLDNGADPNRPHPWGGSLPFHDALDRGTPLSYFEMMLDHGADPTLTTPDRASVFSAAARCARKDVLELFERRGFTMPLGADDAFLAAVARGDERSARAIIASDPDIVGRIQSRYPALFVDFAGADNPDAVRLLLDLGFDAGARREEPPWRRGETALHVAAWRGRASVARLLIERGAPLEAKLASGQTPVDLALLALVEQSEWTPNDHSIEIAELLIGAGAQLHSSTLTLAAAICLGGTDDITRVSREASAEDRQAALAAAALNGKVEGVALLLRLGVNLDTNNVGSFPTATPLHNAVSSGSLSTVKLIVEAGAPLDKRDTAHHGTALDWAKYYVAESKRGQPAREYAEVVEYLSSR